jgi:hypothetical protein
MTTEKPYTINFLSYTGHGSFSNSYEDLETAQQIYDDIVERLKNPQFPHKDIPFLPFTITDNYGRCHACNLINYVVNFQSNEDAVLFNIESVENEQRLREKHGKVKLGV